MLQLDSEQKFLLHAVQPKYKITHKFVWDIRNCILDASCDHVSDMLKELFAIKLTTPIPPYLKHIWDIKTCWECDQGIRGAF